MDTYLGIKNIVLIGLFPAQNFDKYFFIKNQIAKEEEINPNSVLNALGIVQLNTNDFQILIQPNQIIVTDIQPQLGKNDIPKIVETFIKSGPITSITAMGFNFNWYGNDSSKPMESLSKELFYNKEIKLLSDFFNADDSRYGLYASGAFKKSRLKLDIKPSLIREPSKTTQSDVVAFNFNFHFDISNNSGIVFEYLNDYTSYLDRSAEMISIYK